MPVSHAGAVIGFLLVPSRRTTRLFAIALIVAGAAWLRFHAIAAKSFWIDEGASVAIARMDWYDFARLLWRREANMTLYYLLLRGWVYLGGSETWIRALSVIFALATLPVVYLLGKRLFGRRAAMVACVLLAVNAFHIRYSQEARSYTLVVLLVSLASLLLVSATQRSAAGRSSHRLWTAYTITASLAVYAQFYAVLVVGAHSVWMLWRNRTQPSTDATREMNVEFRRALIRFSALTTPIWVFIILTGAGPLRWLERPGIGSIREFMSALTGNAGWLLTLPYVVMMILAAAGRRKILPVGALPGAVQFALSWLLLPIVVTLAVSVIHPVFLPRYLIVCLPALVLLAGAGVMQLPNLAASAVLIGMTALSMQGTASYYGRDFDLLREDWRDASAYVLDHQQSGDAILFHANQGRMPFEYYAQLWKRPEPTIFFPGHNDLVTWRDFMGSPSAHQVEAAVSGGGRVWLILSHTNDSDATTSAVTKTLQKYLSHRGTTQFSGIQVLLYSR